MRTRKFTIILVGAMVLLVTQVSSAGYFTLTEDQHLDVITEYLVGTLGDFSSADVRQGGYVVSLAIQGNAVLQVLEYRNGTYGQNIGHAHALGNSTVIITCGGVGGIDAAENSKIIISGGEVGTIIASLNSQISISGGFVSAFAMRDDRHPNYFWKKLFFG